jgi:hypothetical protein
LAIDTLSGTPIASSTVNPLAAGVVAFRVVPRATTNPFDEGVAMTSTLRQPSLLAASLALAVAGAFSAHLAQAETKLGVSSLAEAKSMYQHDVAACRNHQVDEDMKTCMTEAKRAYDDAKKEATGSSHKSKMRHSKTQTEEQPKQ